MVQKLKERQFYNVPIRKVETVPKEHIKLVKFKNGLIALHGISRNNVSMFKFVKESRLTALEKKYGKVKKYRKR